MWVIMPVVFWAYTNNIQENSMAVFATASVYLFFCAIKSNSLFKSPCFYLGCGSIFLATLCKGIPGLFPLGIFFIYWISCRKISFRSSIIYSIIAASLLLTGGLVLLQNNTANKALHIWFFDRMMHRIASDPVTQNHFYILKGLLM